MQQHFQNLKRYLNENEKHISEYKINALLVVSNSTDMMQTEILSILRAIPGIVRVNIEPAVKRSHYYISRCNIKINTDIFGVQPLEVIFNAIKQQALNIDGVRRFTYISKATKI